MALAAPRRILIIAALMAVAAAVFGVPVAQKLTAGGFSDPGAESSRAADLLTRKFDQGDMQLLIVVSAPDGAMSPAARAVGMQIAAELHASPNVATVNSAWDTPHPALAELLSKDGKAGLIVAGIGGGEKHAQDNATELTDRLVRDRDGVSVLAGGTAMVNSQITAQSQRDLLLMESIAIPFSFLVLVWVFGGLLAAALPVVVGVSAILGSLAVLHVITWFAEVSVFALNLCMAMGLALAIDYTLLMISRYRDELADGGEPGDALVRTMATAGRTVVFSATTVVLPMSTLVLFPMYFLKSFAYAGVATVVFAALAALVLTPAAIVLLGDRLRGRAGQSKPVERQFWYRSTRFVLRRPVAIGLAVVTLLVLLGLPFTGVRWGFPDDRVLPAGASARQVGDRLRDDFVNNSATAVTVVLPDSAGIPAAEMQRYVTELGAVIDVSAVSPPVEKDGSSYLTVSSTAPLFSDASETQLDALHAVAAPAGREVLITGAAQLNRDSVDAITSRLPVVLGLIAVITFVLLFLLTGSLVLPLKALVLNVLSLSAAFGALVWIFQDGHLGAFGTTPTGTLVANIPVLLFCIAFGLSMDYEVFLLSRIREYWLASGRTAADVGESVALGLARTGRVVTAAALVMSISFAALIAANVSFMRMFGLGLAMAVLMDATLVRMMLVPAFMQVMGRWNWWAPKPLARLHDRFGFTD
ncbi:MMPL family transporter [Mycolicibacterium fluoranthenivorans]|uniref:Putative drug exporter of the RND superfamily n=1 Tax=Mycolicibacterium fluoranthenivorans TaxID=258505 RepID=A0A1G4WGT7_9MYCO|nr:MMPL family transporter [Mycolicibacterium fluoranthenivorans]SCX22708.1 putative drug exporter of the RND superfamily [Mycolicibacterium fluoranthenivorans]